MSKLIGIPKESKIAEFRVSLTPVSCAELILEGLEVWIETKAGDGAGFSDQDYQKKGVKIAKNAKELFDQTELIVKVKEPQASDIQFLKSHHSLFCYLHLGGNLPLIQALNQIGLTAYGFETLVVGGLTPLLKPMSAIAGRLSIQLGAEFLHSIHGGRGTLLGGTSSKPSGQVLVLGAGVAGTEAALLASSMGANVYVLDILEEALHRVQSLDPKIKVQISNPDTLEGLLPDADLLIGAVYVQGKTAPHVVSRKQISLLPKGAVVVDIAIDQGGCIETSKPCTYAKPYYMVDRIIHSAITNLPAAVPRTASQDLSQAITPYVAQLAAGSLSPELTSALNVKQGKLLISL